MSDTGETDTGLTGNTVRCWETGERWPDSRFSEHQRWVIVDHQFRTRMLGQRECCGQPQVPVRCCWKRQW